MIAIEVTKSRPTEESLSDKTESVPPHRPYASKRELKNGNFLVTIGMESIKSADKKIQPILKHLTAEFWKPHNGIENITFAKLSSSDLKKAYSYRPGVGKNEHFEDKDAKINTLKDIMLIAKRCGMTDLEKFGHARLNIDEDDAKYWLDQCNLPDKTKALSKTELIAHFVARRIMVEIAYDLNAEIPGQGELSGFVEHYELGKQLLAYGKSLVSPEKH